MNDEIQIVAAAPNELSQKERCSFRELVEKGDEVSGAALAANVDAAKALVLGRVASEIRGVAALKRPQLSYRKRIECKAGVALEASNYPYELGYVFLLPDVRGKKLSHRLIAAALAHADDAGVFATARVDNIPMLATLAVAGFTQTGRDYPGRGKRTIRLLVRPAVSQPSEPERSRSSGDAGLKP
jgi:GNAT superfamily N-acetyltransferase